MFNLWSVLQCSQPLYTAAAVSVASGTGPVGMYVSHRAVLVLVVFQWLLQSGSSFFNFFFFCRHECKRLLPPCCDCSIDCVTVLDPQIVSLSCWTQLRKMRVNLSCCHVVFVSCDTFVSCSVKSEVFMTDPVRRQINWWCFCWWWFLWLTCCFSTAVDTAHWFLWVWQITWLQDVLFFCASVLWYLRILL